jgi:hypothetical protein
VGPLRTPFATYRDRFSDVEGWFSDESQAIWHFLLRSQITMAVRGGFMEIGVWKGKSAFMGALHVADEEPIVLVDINDVAGVVDQIHTFHGGEVDSFTEKSSLFRSSELYQRHRGKIRFFHVDGEHSGSGTYADLTLAAEMVGSRAIISVDDFGNMRYPQLHAGIYRFLFQRPDFRMVLCGANKAYICRAEDFVLYDDLIKANLVGFLTALGLPVSLARTSYAHDFGCFAVQPAVPDQPLIGRDEDPETIVF